MLAKNGGLAWTAVATQVFPADPDMIPPMAMQHRLATNLNEESEAYGYTLAVWGAGAILIDQFGAPSILEIHLYIGGALAGFAILSAFAFENLFAPAEPPADQRLIVASTIHVFGTFGNLVLSYLIAAIFVGFGVPAGLGFLLIGLHVTITYNLGLVSEVWIIRFFSQLDTWHTNSP